MHDCMPICRVCLKTSLEYIDFETPFEAEADEETTESRQALSYLDIFRKCTQFEMDIHEDNMPQSLCDACGLDLRTTYCFLQRAIRANKILHETAQEKKRENIDNEIIFVDAKTTASDEETNTSQEENSDKSEYLNENDANDEKEEEVYTCEYCAEPFFSQFVLNIHKTRTHGSSSTTTTQPSETKDNKATLPDVESTATSIEFIENNFEFEILDLENADVIEEVENEEEEEDFDNEHFTEQEELHEIDEETHDTNDSAAETNQKESSNNFKCTKCRIEFQTRGSLMQHIRKAHKVASKCKLCKNELTGNEKMRDHLKNAHWRMVQCKKCDHNCKESQLLEHERKVHGLVHDEFVCHICSKKYNTQSILNAHLKYHERKAANLKSDACEICGRTFSTQHYLRQHMALHRNERQLHKCNKCDKVYISKTALENHRRMHNGETIECNRCGKLFARQYELKVHMRFHLRDYPFACEICDKKFAIKGHLRTHMWRHQGLKLQCDDCGKLFTSTKSLQEHSYTHSVMPFPCSYCSRAYPSKQKYKVHLKTAHNLELTATELQKFAKYLPSRPFLRKKLNLVQAESVIKEVEISSKIVEDNADDIEILDAFD